MSQTELKSVSVTEICKLPDKQIDSKIIKFANVTMSSEKCVVVREEAQQSIAIVDLGSKSSPTRLPLPVEGAVMNPISRVIATRASGILTLFSLEMKVKLKTCNFAQPIVFWKWIDAKTMGIVTQDQVYHWSLEGQGDPQRVFDRVASQTPVQIINYQVSNDGKWCMLNGLTVDAEKKFHGVLQVYSVDANASQPPLNAPAATFAHTLLDGRDANSNLLAFALKDQQGNYTLKVIEVGVPKESAFSAQGLMKFAPNDVPMSMIADPKYSVVYVMTQSGFLFVYELQSCKPIFASRVSTSAMFTSCHGADDGIVAIDSTGRVLRFALDRDNLVTSICNGMNDMELGTQMARRYGLPGADHIFIGQFKQLMSQGRHEEAAELASTSPSLRTSETLQQLKAVSPQLLIGYFQKIINRPGGKLNAIESVQLAQPLIQRGQQGIEHITNWIKENKLEPSEQLGDELRPVNPQLALSIYLRCDAKEKVCMAFLQLGASETDDNKANEMFLNVIKYAKKKEFVPNYQQLLQTIVRFSPDRAKDFALILINHEEGPRMDVNTATDLFLSLGDVKNSTNILLEYLKPRGDRQEDAYLQTKLFESNLLHAPQVANAIFDSEEYRFTHYDKIRIAQMCENAQLYQRALEHYTEPNDIKRILTNAMVMKPEFLLDFFGKLTPELGLDCLRDLLRQNLQQNIRLVVEVAKKWTELYGAENLIALFEEYKSFNGLYFFLASFVNFTNNPQVVFKYIEAGIKIGQNAVKEMERICRENDVYDAKQVKDFLLDQPFTLKDPRCLIHVCDKHGFIDELVAFLYNNNLLQFIEAYVQRKTPKSAPEVIGALIDLNASNDVIRKILDGLRAPGDDPEWVYRLATIVEKRNRLIILRSWLEQRANEGSPDPHVYTALAKLYIDNNMNARHFLETNDKYDALVVGKFCESRDPTLAVVVYKKGKCDEQLIEVTTTNGFFKEQARYLVERQSLEAWAIVLSDSNTSRRNLVDQVVSTALPESHNPDEVSTTVKAFMNADLMKELIELLERLMLHSGTEHTHFRANTKLQNLLILTAIKVDQKRVMEYLKRLDNYDVDKIASVCVTEPHTLYEEAFFIYKKANKHEQAVNVLIHQIKDFARAIEYANYVELPVVWGLVGKAQLDGLQLEDSIKSFIKAEDSTYYREMIHAVASNAKDDVKLYGSLISYLRMVRKKNKDTVVDNELVYAYAITEKFNDLEDFLQSTSAKLVDCGDRLFAEGLYKASRIVYTHIGNYAKLAKALIKLELYIEAVDAAKKAKSIDTWKVVCFACCDAKEFKLAQTCGLNIIGIMEHLSDLVQFYEQRGYFNELIALLEVGINLDRTHQGIFTQLGIAYARYRSEKLFEFIKLFYTRSNIPQLIAATRQNLLWAEAVFLTQHYEQFDTAIEIMIEHSTVAWKHELCKDLLSKCSNIEIFYRTVDFYLSEHPMLLTDVLLEIEKKVDPSRVVYKLKSAGHIALISKYLLHVQHVDVAVINDAIHEIYIEEENHAGLLRSITEYKHYDQIGLAQKLENHELLEFRRIAAIIYKQNERYEKSIELSKRDKLWQDVMSTCAAAKKPELTRELLQFFVTNNLNQCFAAMLYTCYDVITPDVVLELAWRHGLTDFAMPYMIQTFANFGQKINDLEKRLDDQVLERKQEEKIKDEVSQGQQDAIGLGLVGGPSVPMIPMLTMAPPQQPNMMMPPHMGGGGGPSSGW